MPINEYDVVALVAELKECQIFDVQMSLASQSLYLMLTRSSIGPDFVIELSSVLTCSFTMSPIDDFLPAVIGMFEMHILRSKLDIARLELAVSKDVEMAMVDAFSAGNPAYVLRVDGDLTFNAIALDMHILKSIM